MAKGKGKTHENPQPEGHGQETGRDPEPTLSYAERLRAEVQELRETSKQMNAVNTMITGVLRGRGNPDQKIDAIVGRLYEMGFSDEEIGYIMTQKPGRDGNTYMGYPLQDVHRIEHDLRAKSVQLSHIDRRGHVADVEKRREADQGEGRAQG